MHTPRGTAPDHEQGELTLSRWIVNDYQALLELLGDPNDRGTHVTLAATYAREWLAAGSQDAGYETQPAHPLRTRAIATAR